MFSSKCATIHFIMLDTLLFFLEIVILLARSKPAPEIDSSLLHLKLRYILSFLCWRFKVKFKVFKAFLTCYPTLIFYDRVNTISNKMKVTVCGGRGGHCWFCLNESQYFQLESSTRSINWINRVGYITCLLSIQPNEKKRKIAFNISRS